MLFSQIFGNILFRFFSVQLATKNSNYVNYCDESSLFDEEEILNFEGEKTAKCIICVELDGNFN